MKSGKSKKKVETHKIVGCRKPTLLLENYGGLPTQSFILCSDKSAEDLAKKLNKRSDNDWEYYAVPIDLRKPTLGMFKL